MTEIQNYLKRAREALKNNETIRAENLYSKVIAKIERKTHNVEFQTRQLWTVKLWVTKAELLFFRSTRPLEADTFEESRKKRLDCLRYLYKCSKMNNDLFSKYYPILQKYAKDTILKFGCILPESNNHVDVSCPIYLRQTPIGNLGTSYAIKYDKAKCSICGRDMLDDACDHVPGESYDGKECHMNVEDFEALHVILTKRPKDPQAGITRISYPKKDMYDKLPPDELKRKIKYNLPLVCFLCRDKQIDPTEITPDGFFSMQDLIPNID
jgi:hypothetical protein